MTGHADRRDDLTFVHADGTHVSELRELVEAYYTFDRIAFDATAIDRGLIALVNEPSLGGAWLIQNQSTTVGFFVLTYGFDLELGGHQATVTELYLRPEARRRGFGTNALSFIETHLRAKGIVAYELHVERDNAAARAFYAARGFEAHARIPLTKQLMNHGDARSHVAPVRRPLDTVDHVSLGVNDLAVAKRFYDAALLPLGFTPRPVCDEVGYFLTDDTNHHDVFALFIGFEDASAKRPVVPSAGFHIALRAPTRSAVVAFYEAALRAGGRDNGPPGLRPQYHAHYYGAFVCDPDGHHIEVVCHMPS